MHLEKSEAELIAMSCGGDRDAFYCLIQPCERGVFTAAMSILNNAADAEEVVQEAVMKALAALPVFAAKPSSAPGSSKSPSMKRD